MVTTTRNQHPIPFSLKKAVPALLLLGLLGYLGVTNFIVDNGDSSPFVQQAEALVVEAVQLASSESTGVDNLFSTLQQWEPIPIPAPVEPEIISSSTDQAGDPDRLPVDGSVAGSISVVTEPPPELKETVRVAPESEPLTLIPTYAWVNAFSRESVLNGVPIQLEAS